MIGHLLLRYMAMSQWTGYLITTMIAALQVMIVLVSDLMLLTGVF